MDVKDVVNVLIEQNKSFKEMMQWSITSILGILVLFLAANFYTMRKVRKEEIERVQSDVKAEVLLGLQDKVVPEIEKKLQASLTLLVAGKLDSLGSKLEFLEDSLQDAIQSQKDDAEELNKNLLRVRAELFKLKGTVYEYNGYINKAFMSYLEAAKLFKNFTSGDLFLVDMLGNLEKCAKELELIRMELPSFIEFSNTLDERYRPHCDKIIDLLKVKQTTF
ncbi:hypothetical protein V7088_06080 [Priestia megaterium]|uniref:hypothetical protein n=1 Tax=Priestia megaterium TaxID=1404 RepID=UPI000BF607A2|nr:hypothetical protein [Priestia megaterium]PFP32634.1 hypothetical protein COK03_27430 [Priestia megaterium]